MAKLSTAIDSLRNFVSNLNTSRDKQYSSAYYAPEYSDDQLHNAFRASWMARKIVSIPAKDATRKWREWGAEESQIEVIETLETNLGLQGKVKEAIELSRLFGGAALYFSIRGDDPSQPLELSTIKKGSLEFVTVLSRRVLTPGQMETDPLSRYYGKPRDYQVAGTNITQTVHPSRLAIFIGADLPDPDLAVSVQQGWGDSSLIAPFEAMKSADSIGANISSMVYEAKVDILHIPGLADIMADSNMRSLLVDRIELCSQLKGNNGMLILDAEETYDSKSFSFAGLPDIQQQALQIVAGAADIPITRFLGQAPSGLSSTGESDLRNYYDSVASMQSLVITPALKNIDEALIMSALGTRPVDVNYKWSSLWQVDDETQSHIGKETAETIKIIAESRLFADDALTVAFANLLIERGVLPSLDLTATLTREEDPDPNPMPGAQAT